MLTLIHGGPADADGNRFGADWYDWATLAAANGWLVFRPNYRGSSGYGDDFMLQIAPHLVSKPARTFWKASTRWSRMATPIPTGWPSAATATAAT
jgi:hypothetical protein